MSYKVKMSFKSPAVQEKGVRALPQKVNYPNLNYLIFSCLKQTVVNMIIGLES